jgi:hypothetical protein
MTNRDRPHIWYKDGEWWCDWADGGMPVPHGAFWEACNDAENWWISEGRPLLRPTLTKEN